MAQTDSNASAAGHPIEPLMLPHSEGCPNTWASFFFRASISLLIFAARLSCCADGFGPEKPTAGVLSTGELCAAGW